jgi:hypothetical protein
MEQKTPISLFDLYKTALPLYHCVYSTFNPLLEQIRQRKPYQSTSLKYIKCGKLCNTIHVQQYILPTAKKKPLTSSQM